jgi:hypothetical protein
MLTSKVSEFKSRAKNRINGYINDNSYEIGIRILEKFCIGHHITVAPSLEDFMNFNKTIKRVIIICIYHAFMWIMILQIVFSVLINNPSIWTLVANPIYAIRKPNLVLLCIALCGVLASSAQIICNFVEYRPEFRPIIRLYLSNRFQYGLRNQYYRKFCLKSKLMLKYILGPLCRIHVFWFNVIYVGLIIKGYFDPDFEFSVIKSILSTIVLFVWVDHSLAVIWVGVGVLYFMTSPQI